MTIAVLEREITEKPLVEEILTTTTHQANLVQSVSGPNPGPDASALDSLPEPILGPALKRRQVSKRTLWSLLEYSENTPGNTPPERRGFNPRHKPAPSQNEHSTRQRRINEDPLSNPRAWAAQMARCSYEVITGLRPLTQMTRWTGPAAYRYLEQRRRETIFTRQEPRFTVDRTHRKVAPVRILSARSYETSAEVHEAVIVLNDGSRTHAAALTLQKHRDRWLVSAIRLG